MSDFRRPPLKQTAPANAVAELLTEVIQRLTRMETRQVKVMIAQGFNPDGSAIEPAKDQTDGS